MNRDRFEAIYRDEAEHVLRYLRYRVGHDAAEDLVAETFSVAWRKLEQVPQIARPWLLATARRISANHLRARRKRLANEVADLEGTLAAVADASEDVIRRRDLLTALMAIPPLDREAVLLVTWYDLSNVEAADVMDCSVTAFAVRLHRARRRLERILRTTDTTPSMTPSQTEDVR